MVPLPDVVDCQGRGRPACAPCPPGELLDLVLDYSTFSCGDYQILC